MLSGPIPVRILRAAQFREFIPELVEWGRQGEVSYVPRMRTQLVAARTVAEALVNLANGSEPPTRRAPCCPARTPPSPARHSRSGWTQRPDVLPHPQCEQSGVRVGGRQRAVS
jgi:hypothetical protein